MDLKTLRKDLRQQRATLSLEQQQAATANVTQQFLALSEFQHSQQIAFYRANEGEIDPLAIFLQAEKMKKTNYLPVLANKILNFYTYHSSDPLIENRYHIPEPDMQTQKNISAQDLDLVLVPLVAFDVSGYRLGRGLGFYDRTFEFLLHSPEKKPLLVGLAYEFQKVSLTPEKWDVPLSFIITEKTVYRT